MTRHLLLALLTATALTACTSEQGSSTSSSSTTVEAASGIAVAHNDADVAFVQDMTPHHEGAVEMSELAADRAEEDRVKALAVRILDAQAPELARMAAMAEAWDADLDNGGHGGHGDRDVEALEPLSGAAFDREFLTRMIAHHESALPMAKAALSRGENAQAKELARSILRVQEAEIAEMRRLLAQL